MNTNIKIRTFKEADLESVASIIMNSFKSKFKALASLSDYDLIELLKQAGYVERTGFEGYLVAEKDNKVVGVMLLKWEGQKRPKAPPKPGFLKLGRMYGFLNLIKLQLGLSLLEESIDYGECYIEHIAVDPNERGFGIGTQLINYGKDIVENNPSLNKYTLYVAASNISAVQLYQNLGFRVKSRQNSAITQLLFKERSWLYMTNNLKNTEDKTKYTMQKQWWLGFLGIIGFFKIPSILLFLKGDASPVVLLSLLWFLWFLLFIPRKK